MEFEVLTLPELAAYLRVPVDELLKLVIENKIPAQKIGDEWRFLKRAVDVWLFYGPTFYQKVKPLAPQPIFSNLLLEELIQAAEQRTPSRDIATEPPSTNRGSKQAVLKHFGVFKDDTDIEQQLTNIRSYREIAGE